MDAALRIAVVAVWIIHNIPQILIKLFMLLYNKIIIYNIGWEMRKDKS